MSEPRKRSLTYETRRLYRWLLTDGLTRTIFLGLKFTTPNRPLNPLAYLGVMTLAMFLLLGVTGALLMIYYVPTAAGAWESIRFINDEVPFGFFLRNMHYHASNAMVLLAVTHLFYQYFSGRYKLKYEVLWITGVLLGTITIVEAYTGYDLIMSIRAMLAINIGLALAFSSQPFVGGLPLADMVLGAEGGLNNIILRYYTLHVFVLPIVMLVLMLVHLPRSMQVDVPILSSVFGVLFVLGGMFPVELGIRFDPKIPTAITFPEWYFTGLYAALRTGISAFLAGVVLPTIFILIFLIAPFIDTDKKRLSPWDRPFMTSLGVSGIGIIALTTVWGFRHNNIFLPLNEEAGLLIDPFAFFASTILLAIITFAGTYIYAGHRRAIKGSERRRRAGEAKPKKPMPMWELFTILSVLIGLEIFINTTAAQALTQGLRNLAFVEMGLILII
ncbi:MAG: cytochrome bc complex cytochrome b subunit, partial [Candidatus Bathyarchaeia archaeon]